MNKKTSLFAGIDGKKVATTAGFGVATLALMLLSSLVSDKFVNGGTDIVNNIKQNAKANKANIE